MQIQYVGFSVTPTARVYNFQVIDAIPDSREFVVQVRAQAFRTTALKYQHGPEICWLRLQRALEGESNGTLAPRRLEVSEIDIQQYLQRRKTGRRS